MDYIIDHWRGRHSLARSYWINVVLVGIIASMIFNNQTITDFFAHEYTDFLFFLIHCSISSWGLVGGWRATRAYAKDNENNTKIWLYLAYIGLTLATAHLIISILIIIGLYSVLLYLNTATSSTF